MQIKLPRAKTVADIKSQKFTNYEFKGPLNDCFGNPRTKGVWCIIGGSGSGKSVLSLQIAKQLATQTKVIYDEKEEEEEEDYQLRLDMLEMNDVKGNFYTIHDNLEMLKVRLRKRKSASVVIINSATYLFTTKEEYFEFVSEFRKKKLIIIIGHADGTKANTELEKKIMFDANQKVFCESYKATNKGRRFNKVNTYIIWEHGYESVVGKKQKHG